MAPSASTSRQSTRNPIEKPLTAPVMLPPSRPSETTSAGRTSGLMWKSATREKKESWRITPAIAIAVTRARMFGVTIIGASPPVKTATRSRLRKSAKGRSLTCC